MVYFDSLPQLGTDESAQGLFDAWKNNVLNRHRGEEFLEYAKRNLIGYGSDGAR